jgi:hypothetical protein
MYQKLSQVQVLRQNQELKAEKSLEHMELNQQFKNVHTCILSFPLPFLLDVK